MSDKVVPEPLPEPLIASLAMAARWLAGAEHDWWITASAAMALHGARPITVADIDVLMDERDARRMLDEIGVVPVASDSDRFASRVFATWHDPPVPVEVMAGFRVAVRGRWVAVAPRTRIAITLPGVGAPLFIPSVAELIAHCRLYDRPKDHARIMLLERLAEHE